MTKEKEDKRCQQCGAYLTDWGQEHTFEDCLEHLRLSGDGEAGGAKKEKKS